MRSVPSIEFIQLRLLLIIFLIPYSLCSQIAEPQLKKFSPLLQQKWKDRTPGEIFSYIVAVNNFLNFKNRVEKNSAIKIIYEYKESNVFLIRTRWDTLVKSILPGDEVLFVDEQRKPREELAVSNLDLSADKVNLMFSKFPQYNGNGMVVSVKEDHPDTGDIDFHGRYLPTNLTSNVFSTHATIMGTIIGGGGNTFYEGRGAAWGSTISSSSFAVLLPDPDASYQQYNITLQNHSYGTAIENYYGADAASYDASVITRDPLVHIFSAGNSGTQTSTTGPYANVAGFANITGSFKMAKNIITVGHIDSLGEVLAPSSRGPAYDGRVKPELVAFAQDGSSGAAAIVSGISLVIQQAFKDIYGSVPSSALIKAVLLNSADDVGPKGIDFISGYGAANGYKALLGIRNGQHFSDNISNGGVNNYDLNVPPNIRQLKLTLVWNDPPAQPNAPKALRNDLDLALSLPSTGQVWLPWVLSHFPKTDSLQALPVRERDSLNNVEQITLDNPPAGNYKIDVKGFNVPGSTQPYFIAYQLDTMNRFTWQYPTNKDNIFNGRANILRWESSYAVATGSLEYSLDSGNTWSLVDNAVDLSKGFYKWNPPDSFVTALLRMSFSGLSFVSDTFTISRRFDVFVGFDCQDSFMLFWERIPGINEYQVYSLGNKYMEPLFVTSDTAVILAKQTNSSLYYAIAPLIKNNVGVRSYAYNYTMQGVACYVRSFFGQLIDSTAQLDLELGTYYNVKSITWEKLTLNGFISLLTENVSSSLKFNYTDFSLTHGLNIYRVRIELSDGRVIYSETVTVYFANEPYFVYPNPVPQNHNVILVSNDPDNIQLEIYNSIGARMFVTSFNDYTHTIPTSRLSKGIYFLRIIKEGQLQKTLKLVVY